MHLKGINQLKDLINKREINKSKSKVKNKLN